MVFIAICDEDNKERKEIIRIVEEFFQQNAIRIEVTGYTDLSGMELSMQEGRKFDLLICGADHFQGDRPEEAVCMEGRKEAVIWITDYADCIQKKGAFGFVQAVWRDQVEQGLPEKLDEACNYLSMIKNGYIILRGRQGNYKLFLQDIVYIEVIQRKLAIHRREEATIYTRMSLKVFYELVATVNPYFLYINSGCIINAAFVKEVGRNSLELENGISLPISRRKYSQVKAGVDRYWRRHL